MTVEGAVSTASNVDKEPKTLIGVLATRGDEERYCDLVEVFKAIGTDLASERPTAKLSKLHFVFTGGTYDRVVRGESQGGQVLSNDVLLSDAAQERITATSTRLPKYSEGGLILMSYLVAQRQCSILWPFFDPSGSLWLSPAGLALVRLCNVGHAKALFNRGSVEEWLAHDMFYDTGRNRQPCPPEIQLKGLPLDFIERNYEGKDRERATELIGPKLVKLDHTGAKHTHPVRQTPTPPELPNSPGLATIALIAHDQMKPRMLDFVLDHEQQLKRFGRIITTGTTGTEILQAAPDLAGRLQRYQSGPKGGDIEIATEILLGRCHVVVFFVDPLNPHPHIDDIRVVFVAATTRKDVRVLATERHARDWMGSLSHTGDL